MTGAPLIEDFEFENGYAPDEGFGGEKPEAPCECVASIRMQRDLNETQALECFNLKVTLALRWSWNLPVRARTFKFSET